ncbi:hypothetical protein NC653_013826 [Populus alba x Populus x berolinensis]|uniref:Uncharacterized protein n=1 Tax=Populus alba x Populus x berolinensis TaxID=444605 RepID=A0AAD6W312_9ROSI|nr:hypothetical protein NC653_013826 [Populus alba x Populus x berolinensis]
MRKKKKKKRDTKNKEGSSKSVNIVEKDLEIGDKDMISISSSSDHITYYWILFSTCSYNMKPNKYWLYTYKIVNFDSALIGNEDPRNVSEI